MNKIKLIFHPNAWEDYLFWQQQDKKMLKRLNQLIKDVLRSPYEGIGKPEPLKYELTGCWSRRIDQEHRLIYRFEKDELHLLNCRYHY
jgi:toxin YoeB